MKKLIALTLMVACLACCSLGCPAKKPDAKPATPATGAADDAKTDAPATPAAP